MSGLFQSLEIGKRALLTHQLSMTTIGHNMANVNTPGYSRQKVNVVAAQPLQLGSMNIGNGIIPKNVLHSRDLFLTGQFRRENKSLGEWTFKEKALSQIENYFAEPNEDALGNTLDQFWGAWLSLSENPESEAARSSVVAHANAVARSFHSLDTQLRDSMKNTDNEIVTRVELINQYSAQIANLNRLVMKNELGGQRANDLRDQRDLLIDELSQVVDVSTREETNGTVGVYISGLAIVENTDSFDLGTEVKGTDKATAHTIVWKDTKTSIKITGGELKALFDVRDKIIPDYINKLDDIARTLVTEINRVHRSGYDIYGDPGIDFFDPNFADAANIRINTTVENDPNMIAASRSGGEGDNANALAIHELRHAKIMAFGTSSITGFYSSMIGKLGVDSHEAKAFKGNYEVMMQQIENSRQSVQGVSLDEEMANLVRMQQSYNAAAKLITYIDEALSNLIQGMGVVGR